ncbi:prenyltransferase/squalene oxidase repeat-containing protein [Chloroflexota bacterium]
MGIDNIEFMKHALDGLAHFLCAGVQQRLEPIRLARAGYALFAAGCSPRASFPGDIIGAYLTETQQMDGGWSDIEETLWCLGYLKTLEGEYNGVVGNGQKWLASVQLPCGAWGKNNRDQARITVTALATVFAPELANRESLSWLEQQWEADLSSPTQLTYKGAFFLLAQAHSKASCDETLVKRTIAYLSGEQEEDGGFGPWKGHPLGSDPWSTGVVLWGLSKVQLKNSILIFEKALAWLKSKQLPNGLWPYHYLDHGTAMALIGISSSLRFTAG